MNNVLLKRLRVSLSLFFILPLIITIGHSFLADDYIETKQNILKVTALPGIVRSVNHFEHRFLEYEDYSTSYIPFTKDVDSMDILYE